MTNVIPQRPGDRKRAITQKRENQKVLTVQTVGQITPTMMPSAITCIQTFAQNGQKRSLMKLT